jgi:alpha-1,4-digalacturonate transport system permease protein
MPNLSSCSCSALIRAVQVFDEVFVLTGGGPGSATMFIVQFIYQTGFAESIRLTGSRRRRRSCSRLRCSY